MRCLCAFVGFDFDILYDVVWLVFVLFFFVACVVYVVCDLFVLYCVMLYGLLLCVYFLIACGLHVCCS